MQLSASTLAFLNDLDGFSGRKLGRRDDLGQLLELAARHRAEDTLADLSFQAKFLTKVFGIMTRIGTQGEGYERLAAEYTEGMERARHTLDRLIGFASPGDREPLTRRYLAMSPESLTELMALLRDLNWYKNWLLDHP